MVFRNSTEVSRVWRSVGCGRVYLAADSFEVGRLSSYRKLWEEHVSLYGGRWRRSIVGAGKWWVNDVYDKVPLWSASGPIARRWIVSTCVWKLYDCKKGSECWKIATRGPVGRILRSECSEAVQVGRVRVFEDLMAVFNCSVLTFWSAIKFHRE
jgi:hypothetical protein